MIGDKILSRERGSLNGTASLLGGDKGLSRERGSLNGTASRGQGVRPQRLHKLSRVMRDEAEELDSVKRMKRMGDRRVQDVLLEARRYWHAMDRFRRDRRRNKDYTYGRQWEDIICVDGKQMSEAEYIRSQGNLPLKNNLIRKMVQTVLGVYRSQAKEPICKARDRDEQKYGETMSTVLQYNMQLNRMTEINARCMEEFLISGMVVQRKWYGWRNDKLDCWTDYVQPDYFFIDNNMRDFRGWDVSCVGELHDVSPEEIYKRFAHSPEDYHRLSEIYRLAQDSRLITAAYRDFGHAMDGYEDFFLPKEPGMCRVIEVWRKESKPRYRCHDPNNGDVFKIELEDFGEMVEAENRRRLEMAAEYGIGEEDVPLITYEWFMDSYWYYYCLSPFGDVLEEGETPYDHKGHPYVFKAYPFIDGEVHSMVANVIDQQRYTNRLITMYDWIMRASAKGVLLFPEECLPDGMSIEDIADEWARFNGVIMIKQPKTGTSIPQQVANNCTQIGISEMLSMQLKLFEDITGVNGALQGKPGYSGMSASLYNQQTQNATMTLLDILETFSSFVCEGAMKDVKNIQQFYDAKRVQNIAGNNSSLAADDPQKILDVEFDLAIAESTSTPAFRALANDILMKLFEMGAINVKMLLEFGDFPFADGLLQSLQSQEAQVAAGQTPKGISQEILDQVYAGANQEAVAKAQQMLAA